MATFEAAKTAYDLIVSGTTTCISAINRVRETKWALEELPDALDRVYDGIVMISIKIKLARIPTDQAAIVALKNLQNEVDRAKGQLEELAKDAKDYSEAKDKLQKETRPDKKPRIFSFSWFSFKRNVAVPILQATFPPKWKTQLPELSVRLRAAFECAKEQDAFTAALQVSRSLPLHYTAHLGLRADVVNKLKLVDAMQPPKRVVLICGDQGMGKAALALDVATAVRDGEELKDKFPDGVFDVTFGSFKDKNDLQKLIDRKQRDLLAKVTTGKVDPDIVLSSWLGSIMFGKQCLILLEDVQDRTIIQAFCFAGFKGALLVTAPTGIDYDYDPNYVVNITPRDWLETPREGQPSMARRIVDSYIDSPCNGLQPNKEVQEAADLAVCDSGGCVSTIVALSSQLRAISKAGGTYEGTRLPPGNKLAVMLAAYDGALAQLKQADGAAAVDILLALELFRPLVDIPIQLVELAAAVAAGRPYRYDEEALKEHLLQLQEAGLVNLYQYQFGLQLRLQATAVHYLNKRSTRSADTLFPGPALADAAAAAGVAAAAPAEPGMQASLRQLLAAFLTSYGKTGVPTLAEEYLSRQLNSGLYIGISSPSLSDGFSSNSTVRELLEKLVEQPMSLTASRVAAAAVQRRGEAMRQLGDAHGCLCDFDLAMRFLDQQEAVPAMLLARYGEALRSIGKYEDAAEALKDANRLKSDDPFTLKFLADTMRRLGRYSEALPHLERLVTLEAADGFTLQTLGAVYVGLERFTYAADTLDQALDALGGADADVWAFRAQAKYHLHDYHGARQDAAAAAQLLKVPREQRKKRFLPGAEKLVVEVLRDLDKAASHSVAASR